ncbi:MAG: alanine--glyoxylate aminotransferase family protein [Anaerolineae bacterium]|nr:alanine--glyoxylate aminotransferase family protein [Anaerolineae bacterium]
MAQHVKLFTPGPGDVGDEVLDAMAQPALRHYGPDWMVIHNEVMALLHQVYKTQNDIFMVPGPASAILDMSIGSLVDTGQKIIIGNNGFFGERLNDIARGYGIQIIPFTAPLGEQLDPEKLKFILSENPDVKAVAFVHHETSTTVLNPLRELAEVIHQAGKISIVDTVSSMASVPLEVDDWNIDVCVTAANKCLESVPGIGFVSVSPRAWQQVDNQTGIQHGFYLNLKTWRKYATEWGSWHPTPVTMPTSVILGLRASMLRILNGGLEAHYAKYKNANRIVRRGLSNLGFEMFIPESIASPMATAVKARPEFEIAEMSTWLLNERHMAIGGGLGNLSGKIFRVGHLGLSAERDYLIEFLFSVEEFLRTKGLPVPVGSSLAGLE